MKKILRVVCSLLFATNMSLPADVVASETDDLTADDQELAIEATESGNYHLSLVVGNFGLLEHRDAAPGYADPPLIFVTDPKGKIVKNAQVVTTITTPNGDRQITSRAWPFKGGYLIPTHELAPGDYFVETEIVTGGRLLTDMFSLKKT